MMDLDRVNAYMERIKASERTAFRPVGSRLKVGVDLGTAYIALVVLDEEDNPIACEKQAAGVLKDGVVVDYTGALNIVRELKKKLEERLDAELLTGLAILRDGKVVRTEDEPTGGTHLSLVLAGNYHVSFQEAEAIKQDYARHREILPVVRPVVEKMAAIVRRYLAGTDVDAIYLCGGTCCLTGIEGIFEKETQIKTVKPADPFLVTPAGIAMNCKI